MSDYLVEQLAEIRSEIAELRRGRVTHRAAQVLQADAGSATFAAVLPTGETLGGLSAPPQFLPAPGEWVQLRLEGGTPIYEPAGIAEGAITGREIAPGAVTVEQLDFDLRDYTGGTTIFYGPDEPTPPLAGFLVGDIWLATTGTTADGKPIYETRRWDGAWTPIQDQGISGALAAAIAAEEAANQAGLDALAAQGVAGDAVTTADTAAGTALTAQQTAEAAANAAAGKTTTFRQADQPPTTGRTVGDEWYETDQGNRLHVWTGTWTLTQIGAGGISATARQLGAITTYRQAAAPTSGMVVGDFWIDSDDNKLYRYEGATPTWVAVQDTAIQTAISNAATAQAVADGKVRIFPQPDAPTGLVAGDVGDLWIDTDDDNVSHTWSGTTWVKRQIGNGAIEPQSLIASTVIATGTITAPLLEALMVLTNQVIAGDPDGRHARLGADGLKAYRPRPDGGVELSGQFGGDSTTGDFTSGGRDTSGRPLWSIDETGVASVQGLSVNEDPVIMGRPFTKWIGAASGSGNAQPEISGAQHWIGWANGAINGITTEVGLIEMSVNVSADRWYWIGFDVGYRRQEANEIVFRIRDGGSGSPTISSPEIMRRPITDGQGFATNSAFRMGIWYPTTSGQHRLGLSAATQAGGVTDVLDIPLPAMVVVDMGPRKPIAASVNRMGGGTNPPPPPPAPTQQYFVELAPAGWATYRGNNSQRTDTNGPVQGWDPSGFNGDGKGHWWFQVPNITGTVDRVEFYCYSHHWYYNSGGSALLTPIPANNAAPWSVQPKSIWDAGRWPKPGGRTVVLPADWWAGFRSAGHNGWQQYTGIRVGPSGGTNLNYYGRFDGQSARLRIWFTQ